MSHAVGQPLRISNAPVTSTLLQCVPLTRVAELLEGNRRVKKYVWVQSYKEGANSTVSYGRVGIVLGSTEGGIIFQRTADSDPILILFKQILRDSYQLFRLKGTFTDLSEDRISDMQLTAVRTPEEVLLEACDVEIPDVRVEDIPEADVWNPPLKGQMQITDSSSDESSVSSDNSDLMSEFFPKDYDQPSASFRTASRLALAPRSALAPHPASAKLAKEGESSESSDSSVESPRELLRQRWRSPSGSPPEESSAKRQRV